MQVGSAAAPAKVSRFSNPRTVSVPVHARWFASEITSREIPTPLESESQGLLVGRNAAAVARVARASPPGPMLRWVESAGGADCGVRSGVTAGTRAPEPRASGPGSVRSGWRH